MALSDPKASWKTDGRSKLGHEPPVALPLMHTQYRDLEPLWGKGKTPQAGERLWSRILGLQPSDEADSLRQGLGEAHTHYPAAVRDKARGVQPRLCRGCQVSAG